MKLFQAKLACQNGWKF